jgi:hypothetical protein
MRLMIVRATSTRSLESTLSRARSTVHARFEPALESNERWVVAHPLQTLQGIMRTAFVVVVSAACGSCVDPGADFDAFVGRAGPPRSDAGIAGGDAAVCTVSPGDVEGQYLFAISVTLAPTKPILALADVTTPASGGGTGFAFDAQPLSAADRRTSVGQKVSLGPFQVDQNGAYRAEIPNLQVTGAANPVTGGDIAANAVLTGTLCGDGSFFCGTVSGMVTAPLPLDLKGSTFTFTRVDSPTDLPAQPAIDCAGTLADPL